MARLLSGLHEVFLPGLKKSQSFFHGLCSDKGLVIFFFWACLRQGLLCRWVWHGLTGGMGKMAVLLFVVETTAKPDGKKWLLWCNWWKLLQSLMGKMAALMLLVEIYCKVLWEEWQLLLEPLLGVSLHTTILSLECKSTMVEEDEGVTI